MRIALISKWLARENARFGSEGGFVQQLAEALIAAGHDVVALSQRKGARRGDRAQAGRVPMHLFDAEKRRPAFALIDKACKSFTGHRKIVTDAFEIRHFLKTQGPFDVVWAQAEDPDGTACGLAARLGRIPPLVITVQAVRWAENLEGDLRFTEQRQLAIGFSQAAVVAANSPLSGRWLEEQYGVPKERLGEYRVNLTQGFIRGVQERREQSATVGESNRVLFLGALNPTKAPDIFLEAAQLLAAREPHCQFVVAGGETEKNPAFDEKIERLRHAPELQGRLVFTGALTTEQVLDEISRARLVVCPSRIDTLSRATVESLALGKPVVVTENVGARYLVEETGAGLVTRCEATALCAGMERVLADPSFSHRARSQAAAFVDFHSPATAADVLARVFSRVS